MFCRVNSTRGTWGTVTHIVADISKTSNATQLQQDGPLPLASPGKSVPQPASSALFNWLSRAVSPFADSILVPKGRVILSDEQEVDAAFEVQPEDESTNDEDGGPQGVQDDQVVDAAGEGRLDENDATFDSGDAANEGEEAIPDDPEPEDNSGLDEGSSIGKVDPHPSTGEDMGEAKAQQGPGSTGGTLG